MSDLFSPLRDHEHLTAPPVEDVRRRGDTLRRRRGAVTTAAVAAAVVAILASALLLTGGTTDRSSEPPVATRVPETTPSQSAAPSSAPTTLPADLDIAQGLDDPGSDGQVAQGPSVRWLDDLVVCNTDYSPAEPATDRTAVLWQVPQLNVARDLRLYADEAAAISAATDLVETFRACPRFNPDGGTALAHNQVRDLASAGEGWLVTQTFTTGGQPQFGQVIVVVERVGSSVLVARQDSEGPGSTDQAAMMRSARAFSATLDDLRYQLACVFELAACS